MKEPEKSPSLQTLGADILRLKEKVAPAKQPRMSGSRSAMQMGLELVSGVLAGGGLGFFLDRWLGTSPVLFIVGFFLGAGAGFLNLYRASREMENEKTDSAVAPHSVMDDEEDE